MLPSGAISYHERRTVRFAYCVLGWSPIKIAEAINRSANFINKMILKEKLKVLRARIDAQIIKKTVTGIAKDVEEVTGLTVQVVKRGLLDMIKSEEAISEKGLKLISDITANYHRILQLCKGNPTSITKTAAEYTEDEATKMFVEVLQKKQLDPMFNMSKFLAEVKVPPEVLQELEKLATPPSEDFN